jgi:uncharacterized protein YbjT (DUF2867 family)
MTKVFILGATGYIGGAVLGALMQEWQDLQITALVRNAAAVEALSSMFLCPWDEFSCSLTNLNHLEIGINAIQGSHADLEVITDLAAKADLVVNAADADDLDMVNAILKGCKQSFDQYDGKKTLFIHTSGTMLLQDHANGSFEPSAPVYDVSISH